MTASSQHGQTSFPTIFILLVQGQHQDNASSFLSLPDLQCMLALLQPSSVCTKLSAPIALPSNACTFLRKLETLTLTLTGHILHPTLSTSPSSLARSSLSQSHPPLMFPRRASLFPPGLSCTKPVLHMPHQPPQYKAPLHPHSLTAHTASNFRNIGRPAILVQGK